MTKNDFPSINPGRILGIDYGTKRIGLAVSDPMQILATPYKTLPNTNQKKVLSELVNIIQEKDVSAIIVGMPYHMNGRSGDKVNRVRKFIKHLNDMVNIQIITWDERWSTTSAHKSLLERQKSPSKERHIIDQIAASFILQNFLDRYQNKTPSI
jgi:putative Holliday junction resolvase